MQRADNLPGWLRIGAARPMPSSFMVDPRGAMRRRGKVQVASGRGAARYGPNSGAVRLRATSPVPDRNELNVARDEVPTNVITHGFGRGISDMVSQMVLNLTFRA